MILPVIAHMRIVGAARSYQPETMVSFDNRFLLRILKYEEDSGTYASFSIESYATGANVFLCPEKYRTTDLKSISWDDESYTVTVVSSDIGTTFFCLVDNTWVENSEKNISWSVSRYSEITSRRYEETTTGYKAAFYEKSEIDIARITDWLAVCESSASYYQLVYSDLDSWDMFLYYSPKNGNFGNNDFKFFVDRSTVNIFVANGELSDTTVDYLLIRIQAPSRGAWPSSSELYIDGKKINVADS